MNPERTKAAVTGLSDFVRVLTLNGIFSVKDFERWSRSNEALVADRLQYVRHDGMPPAHLLVKPFFHPKLDLVGLKYERDVQRWLRGHPQGWTDALRLCRGTVLDLAGILAALPYAKFFNLFKNEHPEADNPPDGPSEATVKLDGHLGPIFNHANEWHLTSSGSFTSRTAKLGNEMLNKAIERNRAAWSDESLRNITLLVEIIHPSTRIRCDYHGHQGLVLTGARDRTLFDDKDYAWLAANGPRLGLHVTEIWNDFTLEELRREVANQKPKDREGFVVRWPDGTRGKLKYTHYLDRMSDQNLSYNALMHSFLDGTLKSKMDKMPEELWAYADDMWKKLDKARHMPDAKKAREYLYGLVPPEKSSQYYRKLCREFLAHSG